MSVKIMSLVFDLPFKPKHKLIMLCLANYANDAGENVYPSLTTIQKQTSLSRPAVTTALKDLTADKLLVLVKRGNVHRKSSLYHINTKKLVALFTSKADLLVNEVYQSLVKEVYQTSKRALPDPLDDPKTIDPLISADKPPKRTRKPKAETDERSALPEIQVYREVTGRYPARDQYDEVIRCLAGRGIDEVKPFWHEWRVIRQYSPTNISWMTDWLMSGSIPYKNGNGSGQARRVVTAPEKANGNGKHTGNNEPEFTADDLARAERINARRAAAKAAGVPIM